MAKEISVESPKIDLLIRQIETGEIKIPPLQRPFVWKVSQIIELLESIYNDYPIGSILLWQTNKQLPSARNVAGFKIPDKDPEYPFFYVLDGQQRLSSLYGVFCNKREADQALSKEYQVDPSIFDVYFDFENKKFVHVDDKVPDGVYLSMQILLDTSKFLETLSSLDQKFHEDAKELYGQFSNYEIPEVITKKRELEEVGVIFERINNTGSRLDLFDLMVAITWTESFHLQEAFSSIHKILDQKHFSGIKNKIILQCISAILKESSQTKVITLLNPEDIRSNISLLEESLKRTIDYLATELSVKSVNLLPHAHQIVPACYFFSKIKSPTQLQKKYFNEWFWKTSFSKRYSSSTDRNIDEDIQSFKSLIEGNDSQAFRKINYSISPEVLKDTVFSRVNSFSRAFIVLLAGNHPKDLANGVFVDTGEALSSFNMKEYHHVFPRAFLESKSINKNKVSSLCNFCILPAASNKIISNKAPSDYFVNTIPQESFSDILESNLLPVKRDIYDNDDYEAFLEERAKQIINLIDKKLA
jgi:hypothetical protein